MATSQVVDVRLQLKDEASKKFKKSMRGMEKESNSFTQTMKKNWLSIAGVIAVTAIAVKKLSSTFIESANTVEQMQVKLEQLLGSVEAGNRVFADMKKLAGEVPKTYEEIMIASTQLAGVVRDGTSEIKKLMPIIVDISAGTGLSVQEVTGQIIRMYSAGAASADMFRERGISAALGFEAGATVSAKDTMDQIIAQWEDGTSKYAGAADKLAKTWEGRMSMMKDAWFNMTSEIGKKIITNESVIRFLDTFTEKLKEAAILIRRLGGEVRGEDLMYNLKNELSEATERLDVWRESIRDITNADAEEMDFLVGNLKEAAADVEGLQEQITNLAMNMINMGEEIPPDMLDLVKPEYIERVKQLNAEMVKTQAEQLKTSVTTDKTSKLAKKEADAALKRETKKRQSYMQSAATFAQAAITGLSASEQAAKKNAGLIKGIRIGETIINTSAAVMRAMAEISYPANIVAAAAAAALGAAQIGVIASQGFAQGTDNVPSMLSSGEMVVPRTFASAIRAGDLSLSGKEGGTGGDNNVTVIMESASFNSDQDIDEVFEDFSEMLFERRRAN